MKKLYTFNIAILLSFTLHSQITEGSLEGNNIRANISNSGIFFNKLDLGLPGYESPKDGMNHLIYSLSFWYGGVDSGGNLKLAAELWGGDDRHDTYPGAITDDGAAEAPVEPFADEIYFVSQEEITNHIYNHDEPGYEMPYGLENWPAHGDVSLALDYYLAPFKDLDGDGEYEPETGEYPLIRGDHAAYLIMNDKGGLHNCSGGDPLGIELHYMFYQYESEDDINNTTFINVKVINRGTTTLPEFIVGSFMDGEVGYSGDDYMGTNPENNLIYTYNGDLGDEGGDGGQPGYGDDIPVIGLMALNRTMNVGGYFNPGGGPYGDPLNASDYWDYMNAIWKNGTHFRYGGNGNTTASEVETNFLFDGESIGMGDAVWSELNVGTPPGDRRTIMAVEPTSLSPGEELCYDFAVITNSGSGNSYENANGLIDLAPSIQAFYDAQADNYCEFYVGISELGIIEGISLYPNPSTGAFAIDISGKYNLEIYSMDGRLVHYDFYAKDNFTIQTNLTPGTYMVIVKQEGQTLRAKMIIK